jgi:hypothetical protein
MKLKRNYNWRYANEKKKKSNTTILGHLNVLQAPIPDFPYTQQMVMPGL